MNLTSEVTGLSVYVTYNEFYPNFNLPIILFLWVLTACVVAHIKVQNMS